MNSPWPTFIICAAYYYIVRFAGMSFMKDRPAYECRTPMLIYNSFQTLFSLWIFSRLGGFWLTVLPTSSGGTSFQSLPTSWTRSSLCFGKRTISSRHFMLFITNYANGLLDLPQVCWWRSFHFLHVPQHGSACGHVLLLFSFRSWPSCAKIPLVEKIHYRNAIAPVCNLLHSWLYSAIYNLRLPKGGNVLHTFSWSSLLYSFHQFLHTILHEKSSFEKGSIKINSFLSNHSCIQCD